MWSNWPKKKKKITRIVFLAMHWIPRVGAKYFRISSLRTTLMYCVYTTETLCELQRRSGSSKAVQALLLSPQPCPLCVWVCVCVCCHGDRYAPCASGWQQQQQQHCAFGVGLFSVFLICFCDVRLWLCGSPPWSLHGLMCPFALSPPLCLSSHSSVITLLCLSLSFSLSFSLCGWAGPLALAQLSSASVPQAQAELIYPSAVQSNLNKHISAASTSGRPQPSKQSPAPHLYSTVSVRVGNPYIYIFYLDNALASGVQQWSKVEEIILLMVWLWFIVPP